MPPIFAISKVLGTASIGLWAGYNIGLAHTVYGPLSGSPFESDTKSTADLAKSKATLALAQASWASKLSGAAFAFLLGAYALASRPYRHPYLLYVVLGIPLVGGLQYMGADELNEQIERSADPLIPVEPSDLSSSGYQSISESSHDGDQNRHWVLALGDKIVLYNTAVGALSVGLFVLSLIGLTGESVLFA